MLQGELQSLSSIEHKDMLDVVATFDESTLPVLHSQTPLLPGDRSPDLTHFPSDAFDKDNQQVDTSKQTSWTLEIDQVHVYEFAETQLINAWAPYMLCSGLKELMSRGDYRARFILNVTSMEGKFNRAFKSSKHSHTNMSKAALNMLTLTCGSYFARSNIFMNCVDTGWVSEMNPCQLYKAERTTPLDEIDGAMRVLDPVMMGVRHNVYFHSKFLKDYKETSW